MIYYKNMQFKIKKKMRDENLDREAWILFKKIV